jgi:hypothetical protein
MQKSHLSVQLKYAVPRDLSLTVGAAGEDPLTAKVLPGHESDRAGVVATARVRDPQPPVPDDGRVARPDV